MPQVINTAKANPVRGSGKTVTDNAIFWVNITGEFEGARVRSELREFILSGNWAEE